MKALKFHQLNPNQKLDAVSQISLLNEEANILQVYSEKAITRETEQGYNPDQDFEFSCPDGDEIHVSIRDFVN